MIPLLRIFALKKMPYMAPLLYFLKPEKQEGLGTMGVLPDGTLKYDPVWCESIGREAATGVLLHEAMHLLRRHLTRARRLLPESPMVWNAAADCEINDDLQHLVALPPDGVFPRTFELPDQKLAEWYYDELLRNHTVTIQRPCSGCQPGQHNDKDDTTAKRMRARAELALEKAITDVLKEAEKYRGSLPAGIKKLVDASMGKLDWRQLLRRAVSSSLSSTKEPADFTWRKRSRRQWQHGQGQPIMPGLHSPQPKVAVALDTSGSMNGLEKDCLGELDRILRLCGAGVYFISGDAEVFAKGQVRDIAKVKGMIGGGGDTSFIPLFDAATLIRPDLFIYLTDGCGDAPSRPPPFQTIWCLIGKWTEEPTDWGIYVRVEC